jgi:hypothetical protein
VVRQKPSQQHRFHPSAKANPPIDFDDWNASIESLTQYGICVDIDALRHDSVLLKHPPRVVA